jgi:hypothetical protein
VAIADIRTYFDAWADELDKRCPPASPPLPIFFRMDCVLPTDKGHGLPELRGSRIELSSTADPALTDETDHCGRCSRHQSDPIGTAPAGH